MVSSQEPGHPAAWTTIHSASKRFAVIGNDPGVVLAVSGWADESAVRMEHATRLRITPGIAALCRILVVTNESFQAGSIRTGRDRRSRSRVLRLDCTKLEDIDWEDALEAWCCMLLNGCIADGATNSVAPNPAPAWMSVGLAHCLDPVLRARDRKIALRLYDDGLLPGFAEVLKWRTLPPGRRHEKAVCTLAASWMMAGSAPGFKRMTDILSAGHILDANKMAVIVPGCSGTGALDSCWSARVEAEKIVLTDIGLITDESLYALNAAVHVSPGGNGIPLDSAIKAGASLDALIPSRTCGWMAGFCRERAMRIARLKPGRPSEYVDAADAYCAFLSALAAPRTGKRRLLKLFKDAERMKTDMEKAFSARAEYMNRMEKTYGGFDAHAGEEVLEHSELQRYIDAFDEKKGK